MISQWTSLVDTARLEKWMDVQGFSGGALEDVTPISGGTQNVLLSFRRGSKRFVLRRPPPSPRVESNETMRREARVLHALAQTDVPHPRLIAACDDETAIGVSFYLMEPVEGFNVTVDM